MKTYQELLAEKTKIRISDPIRYVALTMILDGASKIAKETNTSVGKPHLLSAARALIASTEKAIEEIAPRKGDITQYQQELTIYREFIGPQWTDDELSQVIKTYLNGFSPEHLIRKNTKMFQEGITSHLVSIGAIDFVDPKKIGRILASQLK